MSDTPTGLYGWIKSNDGRSAILFVGFIAAVQMMAAMVLFLPLAVIDPDHTPFLGTSGYLARYAPLVLAASIIWVGLQLFWHIETVKRAVGFRFIDDSEEPRLCRLIEPLIMTMALPVPFVGVIEDSARNAFACGIARKKAVVVVTRGLIDDLGDEELSCVLAHELSHIRNGDIRLMAAANIFMAALARLHRDNPLKFTPVHVVLSIAVPAILPLTLAGSLIAHLAMRAGQLSRLAISSAREFIADAEAVQLTQNPAAMASALVKVENRYRVEQARREDDAMMIAGDTEGAGATHPTVAQRIAALARTTGSMVFNAPGALPAHAWDASKTLTEARTAALLRQLPAAQALPRIRVGSRENMLGLTRGGMLMCAATVLALTIIHWSEMNNPRAILAKFDVRPLTLIVGSPLSCSFDQGTTCARHAEGDVYRDFEGQKNTLAGWLAEVSKQRKAKGVVHSDATLANLNRDAVMQNYAGRSGRMTGVKAAMRSDGSFLSPHGAEGRQTLIAMAIAEADQVGCYGGYPLDDQPAGKYRIGQRDSGDGTYELYLRITDDAASQPTIRDSDSADGRLHKYVETRETMGMQIYNMYGLPGLRAFQAALTGGPHPAMVERLRERLKDPTFVARQTPENIASHRALARNPNGFVPCIALRHLPPGENVL